MPFSLRRIVVRQRIEFKPISIGAPVPAAPKLPSEGWSDPAKIPAGVRA